MTDVDSNTDILQQVRDALDAGLTTIIKPVKLFSATENDESPEKIFRISESEQTEDADYIEVDDYCTMLQDCREKASFLDTMDSRTLIPKHQSKLDSQHTPHSISDLHERISSFDIMKWSQKPDCISSFQCARFGWKLCEWGFLACVTCKQILHIPSLTSKFSSSSWAQKLRKSAETTGHLSTCPWIRMPSSLDILSVPQGTNLYNTLCKAVSSFKLTRFIPALDNHYKMIMVDLNLKWLAELTSATLPCEEELMDKSVSPDMVRDIILFLVLSGWTMSDLDDIIKCDLCLREVPLWLCQPTPAENEILDLLSPPVSPTTNKVFAYKELDPVGNHWSWCPWRQRLQRIVPVTCTTQDDGDSLIQSKSDSDSGPNSESPGKDSDPESITLKKVAEISHYQRLLQEFQQECANMSLRYDKENTGAHLLSSVSSFMDHIIAAPTGQLSTSGCSENENGSEEIESVATLRQTEPSELNPLSQTQDKTRERDDSKLSQVPDCNESCVEKVLNEDQTVNEPPKKRIRREFLTGIGDL